jgi:GAF domain-containing protein
MLAKGRKRGKEMLARLRQLVDTPVLVDEEKARIARLLNTTLVTFLVATVLVVTAMPVFYGLPTTGSEVFTLLSALMLSATIVGLLIAAQRGHIRLASAVLLALLWTLITVWTCGVSGISSDSSPLAYPLIIVLAGLLLGSRAAILFTILSILASLGAYYAEVSHLLVVVEHPVNVMDALLTVAPLALTGLLLLHAINSMVGAIARAISNEHAQIQANRELEGLRASLEQRVSDRTQDLQRRTQQLQAAAEVSRAATSLLDSEQLMWRVSELLAERFELYHVGLFRIDATGHWAEYRAGAGETGRRLAQEHFRLEVGGDSLIGWCTAHAQARITQDVTTETQRVVHPLVPSTRSEAALPLIVRGRMIGALSVQSNLPGTFDANAVAVLQTITDQVAVAMENARLFAESQEALQAMRRAYGAWSRQTWSELLRNHPRWGYTYRDQSIVPAGEDWEPEALEAMQTGKTVVRDPEPDGSKSPSAPMVAVPLKIRGQTVGVLSFYKGDPHHAHGTGTTSQWTPEEANLLERLARQMEMALENAQFYEQVQRRAVREQIARQVTSRIRETLDVEAVLRTAVEEVRESLALPEVVVRLAAPGMVRSRSETV